MKKYFVRKYRRSYFYYAHFILFFLFLPLLFGQNVIDNEIENNRKKLKNIRIKMDSLKLNIAETERKRKSTLEQLNIIQNEMSFLSEARRALRKEISLLSCATAYSLMSTFLF